MFISFYMSKIDRIFHLDFYIKELIEFITKICSKIMGNLLNETDIFEEGYCDKPILLQRSLDGWSKYVRFNPHRLAMRMQYSKIFQKVRNLRIDENYYEAYGNIFLFSNPDKSVIKINRSFSEQKIEELKNKWAKEAGKNVIMVSPFISLKEKEIRQIIEQVEGKNNLNHSKNISGVIQIRFP